MYTQNEVVEIVTRFRDLIKTIQEDARVNESIIQESDKAWGDIRHYCEFKTTARRPKKTQLFRLIGSYGRQRRQAKNFLQVAQPLLDFMDKQPNFIKNIVFCKKNSMCIEVHILIYRMSCYDQRHICLSYIYNNTNLVISQTLF